MQVPISNVHVLYEESKFWVSIIGALWAVFGGVQWLKSIKTNDLPHLQAGIDQVQVELKAQTTTIVKSMDNNTDQVKELRQDIKTLTTAMFVPPLSVRAARAAKRKKT